MWPITTQEFQEKYNKIAKVAENEFPEDERFINVTVWDDDTFYIEVVHNRTTKNNQWRCLAIIGSEKSSFDEKVERKVLYLKDEDVNTVFSGKS